MNLPQIPHFNWADIQNMYDRIENFYETYVDIDHDLTKHVCNILEKYVEFQIDDNSFLDYTLNEDRNTKNIFDYTLYKMELYFEDYDNSLIEVSTPIDFMVIPKDSILSPFSHNRRFLEFLDKKITFQI